MQTYSRQDLDTALAATGLPEGALVFVHTALYAPGRVADTPLAEISSRLYAGLRKILGPRGTLAVPTFHPGFCQGEPFDRVHTPATGMGSFAEYIRLLPNAHRSPHGVYSIAAEGPLAKELTRRDTPSAFGQDGPFDGLIEYDAHLLMFGCTVEATPFIRWAEERVGVPYRRWLICRGRTVDGDTSAMRSFHLYAGADGREPALCLAPLRTALDRTGELSRSPLGASSIERCRARDFAVAAVELLQQDPTALLARRPTDNARRPEQR